jgi:hypothetical protein
MGTCHSTQTQSEVGTYTFDGPQLTLKPKKATSEVTMCRKGNTSVQAANNHMGARTYQVGLDGNALVLVGPSCAAFDEPKAACASTRTQLTPK